MQILCKKNDQIVLLVRAGVAQPRDGPRRRRMGHSGSLPGET